MSDRPILFSAPMVRALLDGRKTQTRRLLKPTGEISACGPMYPSYVNGVRVGDQTPPDYGDIALPGDNGPIWSGASIYVPGDRLWVREAMSFSPRDDRLRLLYKADAAEIDLSRMPIDYTVAARDMPSIFMPRWASRLTLTVTDVRVQRLQNIALEDIEAEGYPGPSEPPDGPYLKWFSDLWDSLNAKRAPWSSNPWVVALTFTVAHQNVDQRAAA